MRKVAGKAVCQLQSFAFGGEYDVESLAFESVCQKRGAALRQSDIAVQIEKRNAHTVAYFQHGQIFGYIAYFYGIGFIHLLPAFIALRRDGFAVALIRACGFGADLVCAFTAVGTDACASMRRRLGDRMTFALIRARFAGTVGVRTLAAGRALVFALVRGHGYAREVESSDYFAVRVQIGRASCRERV